MLALPLCHRASPLSSWRSFLRLSVLFFESPKLSTFSFPVRPRQRTLRRRVDWIRAKAPFRSRVLCSWRTKKPGKEEGAFDDAYWMRFSPQLATDFLV